MTLILPNRNMGRVLVDDRGFPVVPQELSAELKDINPRLNAVYHPAMFQFAITMDWAAEDPRRELVKRGELSGDAAWDVLGFLPGWARIDDIVPLARAELERVSTKREDLRRMIADRTARMEKANAAVVEDASAKIVEETFTGTSKNIDVGKNRKKVRSI